MYRARRVLGNCVNKQSRWERGMECLWGFTGLFTFLGEVLMDFTSRKLTLLVKLICCKTWLRRDPIPAVLQPMPAPKPRAGCENDSSSPSGGSGLGRQGSRKGFGLWWAAGWLCLRAPLLLSETIPVLLEGSFPGDWAQRPHSWGLSPSL